MSAHTHHPTKTQNAAQLLTVEDGFTETGDERERGERETEEVGISSKAALVGSPHTVMLPS